MSKFIKLEDAIYEDCILIDEIKCEDCPFYDEELFLCRMVKWLESIPTIEVSEDCISRKYMLEVQKALHGYMPNDKSHELWDKIKSAPSVIPKQKEGEWIPYSKRKPTKEGHYLCSFKKPQRIDNIYVGLAYWTGGRWYGYLANEINAWMPLPEPWKGVDDVER